MKYLELCGGLVTILDLGYPILLLLVLLFLVFLLLVPLLLVLLLLVPLLLVLLLLCLLLVLLLLLSPLLLSAILTLLLLHLDRLSCFCSCTAVPGEEISVYDPTTDKRMILENGELVEPPEDDTETT